MKKLILLSFFIILSLLQLWFISINIRYPFQGIGVKQTSGQWVINRFQNADQSILSRLHKGDIVLKVNGGAASSYPTIIKWHEIERAHSLQIIRNHHPLQVTVKNSDTAANAVDLQLITETVCLLFSIFLFLKIKNSKSALYLSGVFINITIIFMSLGASIRGDALGKMVISTSMMSLPIVFLHFLLVLFQEKGNISINKRFLYYFYGFIAITPLLAIPYFIPSITYTFYKYSDPMIISFFLLGLFLNFCVLSYVYFKHRRQNPSFSTIIKAVWFTLFISFFPFTVLSFIPDLLFDTEWVNSFYTAWFVLFFPLSFAYLIFSKTLYDLDTILRRILSSFLISLIPSLILTTFDVLPLRRIESAKQIVMVFVASLTILSLTTFFMEYLNEKIGKYIFPKKFILRKTLNNISSKLADVSNLHELKTYVLQDIVDVLELHGGAIAFFNNNDMDLVSYGDIMRSEIREIVENREQNESEYTIFTMIQNEKYSSYLLLTTKKNKTKLNIEEMHWIDMIISYLAVSLENIYLVEKLSYRLNELAAIIPNEHASAEVVWFRKSMFEIQEKERFKTASDIHDSTIQDILYAKRILQSIQHDNPEYQKVETVIKHMETVNNSLRHRSFEIFPYLLNRIGLIETIRRTINLDSEISGFSIQFHPIHTDKIEELNIDIKLHLYRIVQELLNNAKKHSKATSLSIDLIANDNTIRLNYSDNGIGFNPDLDSDSKKTISSGLGIQQLKSRILYLNGNVEIESNDGEGTYIFIEVPNNTNLVFPFFKN